jgi:hypothetical protein
MGLIDKIKPRQNEGLTKIESEFLLAKLRTATFRGDEFEMFYTVFKKISQHIETIK